MNTRHSDRLLLCLCWIIYLGMILTSGALSSFIATWQHTLILVAAVTFVVLAAVSWWAHDGTTHEHHQHSTRSPADQVIQTLVHCLPLFLIAALGATALGSQAFSTSGFRAPAPGLAPGATPAHAAPPGEFTIADVYSGHPLSTSEVTVIGMAYAPSDEDYARLPGGLTKDVVPLLLYRYQIICCAADATPLYIGVLDVDRTRFANDSWVRIIGTLTPPAPPANVGILRAISIEAISEPAEPYLKRSL